MKKNIYFFLSCLLILMCQNLTAQVSSMYSFTANNAGAFTTNGTNIINMSVSYTMLIGNSTDEGTSTVITIGFDFLFMGQFYSNFSVSPNGIMRLEPTGSALGVSTSGDNNANFPFASSQAILAPFYDDLKTVNWGNVSTKVVGTAPNRCLVVEWLGIGINKNSSSTDGRFQIRIYETTGVIEYVYGNMAIGTSSGTVTATIGFSAGTATDQYLSVTVLNNYPTLSAVSSNSFNNNLVNSSTTGNITALNYDTEGARLIYRFTPPVLANFLGGLNISYIGMTSMRLSWSSVPGSLGYVIYRSTDGVNFTRVAMIAGTKYDALNLTSNTRYYWRVNAYSEGFINNTISNDAITSNACSLSGVRTIGVGGDYPSLSDALFDTQSKGVSGAFILELKSNYTDVSETYPLNFYTVPCASSVRTITIRPESITSSSRTFVNTSASTSTFNFDGGSFYIIDGRAGGIGTNNYLDVSNTNTITQPIISFINTSQSCEIKYCNIQGKITSGSNGLVSLTGSGAFGNNQVNLSNNNISSTTSFSAKYCIYVNSLNSSIVVQNNNIFNFSDSGIYFNAITNGCTISGNQLYNANSSSSAFNISPIYITSGNNHIISGNFIGGTAINCGGTAWTNSNTNSTFHGIRLDNGITNTTISNNTVGNITLSGAGNNVNVNGIRFGNNTGTTMGTNNVIRGNIIRDLKSAGTSTGYTDPPICGLRLSCPALTTNHISQNQIYNIEAISTTNAVISTGILSTGVNSVTNNITCNKIYSLKSPSTQNPQLYGIYINLGITNVSHNQITINNGTNTNAVLISGIYDWAGVGINSSYLYNSIYVGGSALSGSQTSFAFYRNYINLTLTNNICINARTGGTGEHLSIESGSSGNIVSNYNLLVNNDANKLARFNGTTYNFSNWKTNSSGDINSWTSISTTGTSNFLNLNPNNLFMDLANGNLDINPNNSECWYSNGKGISITGQTFDYSSVINVRSVTSGMGTDIGSDEFIPTSLPIPAEVTGTTSLGGTQKFNFGGRQIAEITWENSGTLPVLSNMLYFSGVNPNNFNNSARFFNAYWRLDATGGSGYSYDMILNYDEALLGRISSAEETSGLVRFSKKSTNALPWITYTTSNGGSVHNSTTNTLQKTGLNSFSEFSGSTDAQPLPVSLLHFEAIPQNDKVLLKWITTMEINNKGFEIEVSQNAQNFRKIGFVDGAGNSSTNKNYDFITPNLYDAYYRLKQIDFDGSFSYSKIVFVESVNIDLVVYPNPAQGKIKLLLDNSQNIFEYSLMDSKGVVYHYEKTNDISNIENKISHFLETLPNNLYILQIKTDKKIFVKKINKY